MADGHQTAKPTHGFWIALSLGAIIVVNFLGGCWFIPKLPLPTAWIATVLLIILIFAMIGRRINGRWNGILIDSENRVSLSRLQLCAWTTIIIAAIWTVGAHNARVGGVVPPQEATAAGQKATEPKSEDKGALNFTIPTALWLLMGISVASAVTAPAIKDARKNGGVSADTTGQTDAPATNAHYVGDVYVKDAPIFAGWTDIFLGDFGGAESADISKVQQFLITGVVLAVYSYGLWFLLSGNHPAGINHLPPLDNGLLTLIAISHAGYLADKQLTNS